MTSVLGARLALNLCPAQCRFLKRILQQNVHNTRRHEWLTLQRHLHSCVNSHCHKWPSSAKPGPHTAISQLVGQFMIPRADKCSDANVNCAEATQTDNGGFSAPVAEFDWDYLCDPDNRAAIAENISNRKGVGDIDVLLSLCEKMQKLKKMRSSHPDAVQDEEFELLREKLLKAAAAIPNTTHPDAPIGDESEGRVVETCGRKREFDFRPKTIVELGSRLDILRTENVGITTGPSTYYLKGALAHMEQALIKYTVDTLCKKGFVLMSVPDLIHPSIIEGCGFSTTGERTQVYRLETSNNDEVCLAGTGEMPLAGYFVNKVFSEEDLPQKVMTVSRCFRAETSSLEEERGIYRVHQFTKVELFVVTANETGRESHDLLEELRSIEGELFTNLGIHFRVLDMPSQELGAPACRKYDMETWMPAKEFWGEISSASNCTDFQSRRLNIKYTQNDGTTKHTHTVNGTACALPRMLMTLAENGQNKDGNISIPEALQPYMDGIRVIERMERGPKLRWTRFTNTTRKQSKKT